MATKYELSHDQQQALIARFDPRNSAKTEKQIANQTKDDEGHDRFAGEAAFKKLMTEVYRKLQPLCPELETLAKGKQTKLKACLQAEFKQRQPILEPPVFRSAATGLKAGAPFPGVRLPETFVPRPEAFDPVKQKLLAADDRALVVRAIAGLGGLGKSVLAAALVLDAEVQMRFADGILWVTLGQNPDLQNLLGDWIRTLDKSRESYSATTLESASSYLQTLLIDKRMLLVVDDAWNGAHVEHFRVGGAACRVLVTTREAQIEEAEVHSLGLMSEEEAIALVRQKLKRRWKSEQEPEVKAFAKSLGYLPLALDLAANQVLDGLSWEDLRQEFEAERRSVALEVLDSSEAWDCLDENQQRKYSLRACFNLSLRRLSAEQLRQFAWLGVLPEDVSLDARMAVTLWELSPLKAKKSLIDLRNRSFLTSGTETLEGEPTYRVHDLMHDMARGLIEQGTLDTSISTLADAHAHLLDRYRQKTQGRWDRLPNDGYIHRHLTWHFVQAGMEDEVHALMAMSDDQGRNAWFEACDRLGQPAIFVQDVKRGWAIAEQSYEEDNTRSIVLQCRYALITATLNSLVGNLPIGMMAEFVKRQYWTPEQAWSHVEQMQGEEKIAEVIEKLAPYLPKLLFRLAVEKARSIQNEETQAEVLSTLATSDVTYFSEALDAARSIQDEYNQARLLNTLANIDGVDCFALLKVARSIQDEYSRATVLITLATVNSTHLNEALDAARSIQDEYNRAEVLSTLATIDSAYTHEILAIARSIQDEYSRALMLGTLATTDSTYLDEALDAARSIQDKFERAEVLSELATIDSTYFNEALDTARTIQDESKRAEILSALATVDGTDCLALLDEAQLIQDESSRAKVLSELATINATYFSTALDAARSIWSTGGSDITRSEALITLANLNSACFSEALDAARSIRDGLRRGWLLSRLATINAVDFSALLDAARSIQDDYSQAVGLSILATFNTIDFSALLDAARSIRDESSQAWLLSELATLRAYPKTIKSVR
ncbi:NB-ARC domain-containing protein [Phormidesmis sp. 146-12]